MARKPRTSDDPEAVDDAEIPAPNVLPSLSSDDHKALISKLDQTTTRLGERIQKLVGDFRTGVLTETEEEATLVELEAVADRLISMGTNHANLIPSEAPTPPKPPKM